MDLRKIGIGVSYADKKDRAQMTVGLLGARARLILGKRLHEDYETDAWHEGKWITDDYVGVIPQPLYKLN